MSGGSVDQQLVVPADPEGTSRAAAKRQVDLNRVVYRETHTSRAVVASVAAILVMVLAGYGLLEAGVHAVGQPAWLIEPQLAAERIVALPAGMPPLLLGASGAVIAMAGLFFLVNAILPGRRARHVLNGHALTGSEGAAVVVDDEVIASALGRRARTAANVTPEQVMVVVSQRQVVVNVRPTSGVPVAESAVLAAVEEELSEMSLIPTPEVSVYVSTAGVIGA